MKRATVNFRFRDNLNKVLGGKHHSYCYQCSACVAVCPAARYTENFNPRLIMLRCQLGLEEELIGENSPIWLCTNCYSCYERCPQDTRPIEVIIALKNMAVHHKTAPAEVEKYSEAIIATGFSSLISQAVHRKRQELGLPPLKHPPLEEVKEIL